uniref:Uncharacterized protein n=1 Tax=Acrobeloides nanus TaxID=290746 RepID=A0A914CTP2_9BILA
MMIFVLVIPDVEDDTGMMLVTTNKNKLMADTIEIVRIRNDYEDILFKRPRKRETFNILTREWSKLNAKNIPASLICYTICYDPNPHEKHLIGYIFGGAYDPNGSKMSNKLYKFYINVEGSIRFQELNIEDSEDNKPSPRCGSSLTMSQTGKLYLIGGADEKCYLSDIWVLDTTNGKLCWEKIEKNQIRGRYTHGTALIHENILLLGGGDGDWSACFDQIVTFDISTQQFITISTLPDDIYGYPHARQFHSYVTNRDEVYIIGGWAKNKPEMTSSSVIC